MTAMREWLSSLPMAVKAAGALAGVGGTGVTLGLLFGGWIGLPAQVADQERDIRALQIEAAAAKDERLETLHKLDRVLCLLTLPDSTRPIDAQRACP